MLSGGASPPAGGSAVPSFRFCKYKTSTMLRMVLLFSQIPFRKQAFFGSFQKQKPPDGGACFLLVCGAGGSRTRVQSRQSYAFYMPTPSLIVGRENVVLGNRISVYPSHFIFRREETVRQSLIACASLSGRYRASPPGKRLLSQHLVPGLKVNLLGFGLKQQERKSYSRQLLL